MGIAEVLTLIFIILKLTEVIAWSWWYVLLPSIISFSFYVLFFVIKLVMVFVAVIAVRKRKILVDRDAYMAEEM
ncbi:transmembrane Fragile-X-F protein [Lysinibacillus parviboronicapiens]|uniref:transmembrane Fragile-X-F protein n=1 Tax=Lysinibacillus parviboronicapiens TaxID=436516 RepID=UPI000D376A80|nr:transmembrane Fragile-X-F protein [Lysinibacillus parviboronicapiens]